MNKKQRTEYERRVGSLSGRKKQPRKLLTYVIRDPTPLDLTEPVTLIGLSQGLPCYSYEPDPRAWLYCHLPYLVQKGVITEPVDLVHWLYVVDTTIFSCWNVRFGGERVEPMGHAYKENSAGFIRNAMRRCGINGSENSVYVPDARTVLHFLRWGVSDKERNYWGR